VLPIISRLLKELHVRRALLSSLAVCLTSAGALAGEPTSAPPIWQGVYLGGHLGGESAWTHVHSLSTGAITDNSKASDERDVGAGRGRHASVKG
jgi:hypothetical protein